jgi:Tfp pilus assembly protein PilV
MTLAHRALSTMKRHYIDSRCIRKGNRGLSLIEGLISVLLVGVLGLGFAYVTITTSLSKKYMNTQGLTVNSMRYALQQGNCTSNTLAVGGSSVAVSCSTTPLNYTITSTTSGTTTSTTGTISVPVMQSNTTANSLLGGQISMDASQK